MLVAFCKMFTIWKMILGNEGHIVQQMNFLKKNELNIVSYKIDRLLEINCFVYRQLLCRVKYQSSAELYDFKTCISPKSRSLHESNAMGFPKFSQQKGIFFADNIFVTEFWNNQQ